MWFRKLPAFDGHNVFIPHGCGPLLVEDSLHRLAATFASGRSHRRSARHGQGLPHQRRTRPAHIAAVSATMYVTIAQRQCHASQTVTEIGVCHEHLSSNGRNLS